jgi:hypothetical protein
MGHYTYSNIIYGWVDEYGKVMDYETIEKLSKYVGENFYLDNSSSELRNGEKISAIYGIFCDLDEDTGLIKISDKDKNNVEKAYKLWCNKISHNYKTGIKYINCISGDPEWWSSIEYYDLDL